MGILSRFVTVIRSNLNSLLNSAEDPTKILEQTLIDMDSAFKKAKEQVAKAVADEKRMEKSVRDQQKDVEKWTDRAKAAVGKGDDELAKEALRRKGEHAGFYTQYTHELAAQSDNVQKLKDGLKDLENKIGEIKRKKHLLISKQKRADAQDQIYKTLEGISGGGALDTIERMEEKIEDSVALADARQSLSEEFQGDQLEAKFKNLDGGDVDQELLEMKKQLQLDNK